MKKLTSFVLALAMAAVCAAPAMAEGADSSAPPASSTTTIEQNSPNQSGETTVTFKIDPAYMVTIPGTVTLVKNDANNLVTYENLLELKASNVRLEKGKELHITISNANDYKLTAGTATLDYTINNGKPDPTEVVATFVTQAAEQTKTLRIKANDPQYAGNYTGTLNFTIAVANTDPTT